LRTLANWLMLHCMNARAKPLTIAFYVAFALWFTATRYSGSGFYGWLAGRFLQDAVSLLVWGIFFALIVVVARRSLRVASFPWADLVVVASGVAALDLFWRLYLSRHAWGAFKLTSVVVDAATPIIGLLGIAALVGEWRRGQQLAA
jgi:hypothetical protein